MRHQSLQNRFQRSTIYGGGPTEMKRSTLSLIIVAIILCAAPLLLAAAKVGDPAPTFTATASDGKTYKLGDYRGKYVVLEWHNNACPYVGKQYASGDMQKLQKLWTGKGVVWFTVLSSAPGKQGFVTASEENAYITKMQAAPSAALLDPRGGIAIFYDGKSCRPRV